MLSSAEIRSTTFARTRVRGAYDVAEVDAFLAGLALAVDTETTVSRLDVINARFSSPRIRVGYRKSQVDDFLDRIVESLK